MKTERYNNIEECLGNAERRYFSNGFKNIDYQYNNIHFDSDCIDGSLSITYDWEHKKEMHSHLGTIEYIAISLFITEKILCKKFNLKAHHISKAWINKLHMKIKRCITFERSTEITFKCELLHSEKINDNLCNSCFQMNIGGNIVNYSISHLVRDNGNLPRRPIATSLSLFCDGYKQGIQNINNITIKNDLRLCNASLIIQRQNRSFSGIGSSYNGILLTDIILVSGQLLETILHTHEIREKNQRKNLLLREFYMSADKPNNKSNTDVEIFIEDIRLLKKKEQTWRSIQFRSSLGNINSQIKAVSQLIN